MDPGINAPDAIISADEQSGQAIDPKEPSGDPQLQDPTTRFYSSKALSEGETETEDSQQEHVSLEESEISNQESGEEDPLFDNAEFVSAPAEDAADEAARLRKINDSAKAFQDLAGSISDNTLLWRWPEILDEFKKGKDANLEALENSMSSFESDLLDLVSAERNLNEAINTNMAFLTLTQDKLIEDAKKEVEIRIGNNGKIVWTEENVFGRSAVSYSFDWTKDRNGNPIPQDERLSPKQQRQIEDLAAKWVAHAVTNTVGIGAWPIRIREVVYSAQENLQNIKSTLQKDMDIVYLFFEYRFKRLAGNFERQIDCISDVEKCEGENEQKKRALQRNLKTSSRAFIELATIYHNLRAMEAFIAPTSGNHHLVSSSTDHYYDLKNYSPDETAEWKTEIEKKTEPADRAREQGDLCRHLSYFLRHYYFTLRDRVF